MAGNSELIDSIEACRTCGVFYLTSSNFLRPIFYAIADDADMTLIRMELMAWKIEIEENDGYPQYMCTCCIHEFQKIFKFKRLCLDMQSQWRHFYNLRQESTVQIKTEKIDPSDEPNALTEEENICDFIYVDDLSDSEYDGTKSVTPFNIPHVPIKNEIIEGTVPSAFSSAANNNVPNITEISTNSTDGPEQANEGINLNGKSSKYQTKSASSSHSLTQNSYGDNLTYIPAREQTLTQTQCYLCLHISATQEQHQQHLQRIHDVKDLECHICGKQFRNSTSSRLKFHMKWHKISKHIKCAQCEFFCGSRDILKEHTRAIHTKIECNICGKKIQGKKMKIHMRSHTLKPWPCSYCENIFDSETELERHIWQVHAQEETSHNSLDDALDNNAHSLCTPNRDANRSYLLSNSNMSCDQLCTIKEDLDLQNIRCQTISDIKLEQCDEMHLQNAQFQYNDAADLSADVFHTAMTVNEQQPPDLAMGQCSQGSIIETYAQVISSDEEESNSRTVNRNEKSENHNIINKFNCPKCTQTFVSTEELCSHYQYHFEKPNFSCEFCGKMFDLKFSLNRHLKKHKECFKN